MKNRIMLLIVMLLAAWQGASAQDKDTVWTRDLWQLGSTIREVQFTPDGQNVAVAIENGVYIFDITSGNLVKDFSKYMYGCRYFTFSDDGKKLITASDNDKIIIWDYEKGDTIRVFNEIAIQEIKLINDNIIIGIWNLPTWQLDSSKVCLFDINTGQVVRKESLASQNSFIEASVLPVSKENNLIAVVIGNKYDSNFNIELCDLTTLKKIATLGSHASNVTDLAFSSDGKYLASASRDGIIKIS